MLFRPNPQDIRPPTAVKTFSYGFRLIGLPVFIISIIFLILAVWGEAVTTGYIPAPEDSNIGSVISRVLSTTFLSIGLVGLPLGLLTALSGLGLSRMKRWGLNLSYLTLLVWILEPLLIIILLRSPISCYAATAILIDLPVIAVWQNLSKIRPYFAS